MDSAADSQAAVERIYREEYGRIVASLVRRFGDIDIAEEAAGEALLAAVERWPRDGVPPNPGGWLTTTAGNRAIDRIRRESHRDAKHQAALMIDDDTPHEPTGIVEDDRLRLIFTCCHPALAPEVRVALTLRLLGGLTVAEIAQAFLVPETTMAQRITRAKKKISVAKIPYRVPSATDLGERVNGVLAVIYLVYNEGYLSSSAEASPIRDELTGEAIRLARILRSLLPEVPEVTGLLALMLLTEARRGVRVANGELVPMHEQDRGGWDRELIAEGHDLVRECLTINRPGQYQLLAAINAVHTDAPTGADTDWSQIAALYSQLNAVAPSPIVQLNRAVAIAELDGPEVALAEVDRLALSSYHPWHATRADLLRRLGRSAEAREAYDAALAHTDNEAERAYLTRRRGQLA
jgi:RNA polymerase sigma-70 factor (ECF subfamily)